MLRNINTFKVPEVKYHVSQCVPATFQILSFIGKLMEKGDREEKEQGVFSKWQKLQAVFKHKIYGMSLGQHEDSQEV